MITVDGTIYDVDVIDVDLDTEFEYKYAERMQDMSLKYELGGIFFNQSLTFGSGRSDSDMAKLWNLLSSKSTIDSGTGHNVQIWLPIGKTTFLMYPNKINIKMLREKGSATWWTGMTVKFIATSPARS